jgi:hypothetical protein
MNQIICFIMESIRILMIIPYFPNQTNVATLLAKNILTSLQKKTKPTLIWILLTPSQKFENIYPNIKIKPIQNYHDACDIMDKEKPDIVITSLSFSYSTYPFIIAAKFKKIPLISYNLFSYNSLLNSYPLSSSQVFLSKIRRFFSKSDINNTHNPFSRGEFYLYKYFFYLKTLKSCNFGISKFFSHFIESLWINSFGTVDKKLDSRLISDKVCLPYSDWIKPLTKIGFPKNLLIITGSPILDHYVPSLFNRKSNTINDPIKILIVTNPLYSHGLTSKKTQMDFLSNVITQLIKINNFDISLKIHPTSESLQDYQEIQNKFKTKINIFQKEKLGSFIQNFDIALSFGSFDTSNLDVIITGTPLISITFPNFPKSKLIKHKAAYGCDHIRDLPKIIQNTLESPPSKENIIKFFNTVTSPLDGCASERMANVILNLYKKSNK